MYGVPCQPSVSVQPWPRASRGTVSVTLTHVTGEGQPRISHHESRNAAYPSARKNHLTRASLLDGTCAERTGHSRVPELKGGRQSLPQDRANPQCSRDVDTLHYLAGSDLREDGAVPDTRG